MQSIIISGAWGKIRTITHKESGPRILAVAYVTQSHIKLRKNDVLICDASLNAIRTGETAAKVLLQLFDRGIEVYNLTNLHAKAGVIGKAAFIGSANLSDSSENALHEAVLVTTDSKTRAQILGILNNLKAAAKPLSRPEIEALCREKVVRRALRKRRTKQIEDSGNKTWLIGVSQLSRLNEDTQIVVDRGMSKVREIKDDDEFEPDWIRMPANGSFGKNAKPGDRVIEIFKHPRGIDVYPPMAVLHCERQGKKIVAFLEPGDGSFSRWRDFSGWAKKAGLRVAKGSTRQLSAKELVIFDSFDGWE